MRSQSEILSKHSKALQRCLSELETVDLPPDVSTKIKAWMERANLIRIASVGMVSVSIYKLYCCIPVKWKHLLFLYYRGLNDFIIIFNLIKKNNILLYLF